MFQFFKIQLKSVVRFKNVECHQLTMKGVYLRIFTVIIVGKKLSCLTEKPWPGVETEIDHFCSGKRQLIGETAGKMEYL